MLRRCVEAAIAYTAAFAPLNLSATGLALNATASVLNGMWS